MLVFQMPANANNVEIWRMATDENATRLVQHEMESGMHSEGEQESIHSDRAGRNQSRTSLQSSGIRERFRSLTDLSLATYLVFVESRWVIWATKLTPRRLDGRHKQTTLLGTLGRTNCAGAS